MPPQQHSRINLADLKGQIVKKIGADRAQRYFSYLNRLLSQKLGKAEFDKLCYLTIGRENLVLHNQLIQSILKNACHGTVPPPIPETEVLKSARVIGKRSPLKEDGYTQIGGISASLTPNSTLLIGSNGDVLPMSPRKDRSGIRDRRPRDPRSEAVELNGKTDFVSHQLIATEEALGKNVTENGDLYLCDQERSMRHRQGLAEQPAGEIDDSLPPPNKRPRISRSPNDLLSVHSKGPGEVIVVEDGEEVEQNNSSNTSRIPLKAPLGIPFCSASLGGARRVLHVASSSSSSVSSFIDGGELFDAETLRKRMEEIAGTAGLNGVSLDCANLLNNGLDMYLKRLIRSCIELVGARSGHEPIKHSVYKQQPHGKLINGVRPGHQMHLQSSSGNLKVIQEPKGHCPVTFLDFKVAMELNPQQLGEDWPLLLEKIYLHPSEE